MILVRAFIGGKMGQSRSSFETAVARIVQKFGEDKVRFEFLDTDTMKNVEPFRFTPAQFINWLLKADIHVMVGHMHQV